MNEKGGDPPSAAVPGEGPLDPAAMYEAEADYVWNALRRLGVPERDRDDVCHDVFIAAFRRLDGYERSRPLRPWLFGFCLRTAARYRERARHRREVPGELPDAADPRAGAEDVVALSEKQRLVERALEGIELDRRGVFILHDIDGQGMPEIALALGLRLNTAYSRLRLARAEFTTALRRLQGAT